MHVIVNKIIFIFTYVCRYVCSYTGDYEFVKKEHQKAINSHIVT